MPLTNDAKSLADEVWAFLERALAELDPEREIPATRDLSERIANSWPVNDEGWATARRGLAQTLAERLDTQPQLWARALRLLELYLDRATLDEPHPRHDDTDKLLRGGRRVYAVELDLAGAFAEVLLEQAVPAERSILYDTLDDWGAWKAVAVALERLRLPLDATEIALLLTRAARFTRGDGAADEVLVPIREGLEASAKGVDELLDGWLEAAEPHVDLDLAVVGLLALWRLPERDDGVNSRRRLVRQLLRLPPRLGAWIALHVAFRSWPASAELEARRDLMIQCLEQLGADAVVPALAALAHDRNTPPERALPILDAIVAHVDDTSERMAEVALERVAVLRWVASAYPADEVFDVATFVERLPSPEAFPFEDRWLTRLDRLLATLAHRDPALVRVYVLDWIEAHVASLGEQGLDQLLPKTRAQLSGARWLVEAAVSPRPELRHGAMRCLLRSKTRATAKDFADLDRRQVQALAHVILSEAASGASVVDLLFDLARARSDCLVELGSLIGEEAMRTYPGQYRRSVDAWAAAVEDRPQADVERVTVVTLQQLLDQRTAAAKAKHELKLMIFDRTSPARRPTAAFLARAFQAGMDERPSLFRMLATQVPIACGAASTWELGDLDTRDPQPFTEVSHEMEGLSIDAYDPVAGHFSRIVHEREAQRLVSTDDAEEDP